MLKVFANKIAIAGAAVALGAAGATGYALAAGSSNPAPASATPVVSAHIADAATDTATPTATETPTAGVSATDVPTQTQSVAPTETTSAAPAPPPSSAPAAPSSTPAPSAPPVHVVVAPPPSYTCTETHTVTMSAVMPDRDQVTWNVGASDYTVVTSSGAQTGQDPAQSGYTAPLTGSWSKTVSVRGCGHVSVQVGSGSCRIVIDGAVASSAGTDSGHVSEGCSAETPK